MICCIINVQIVVYTESNILFVEYVVVMYTKERQMGQDGFLYNHWSSGSFEKKCWHGRRIMGSFFWNDSNVIGQVS